MTEREFIDSTRKVHDKRHHTFNKGYVVRDYYYYFKRHNKNLTEAQFSSALRALFKVYFNNLITGKDALFGSNLGRIELRKTQKRVTFENGKLKVNLPVDWNTTLKLWYSDESCRKKKTLVYQDNENTYKIKYNKSKAEFNNKQFIKFRTGRRLKLALKHAIIEDNLDSFSQYENY